MSAALRCFYYLYIYITDLMQCPLFSLTAQHEYASLFVFIDAIRQQECRWERTWKSAKPWSRITSGKHAFYLFTIWPKTLSSICHFHFWKGQSKIFLLLSKSAFIANVLFSCMIILHCVLGFHLFIIHLVISEHDFNMYS